MGIFQDPWMDRAFVRTWESDKDYCAEEAFRRQGEIEELRRELREYRSLGMIDHLRELVQAERDGKFVILPCQPGATVQHKENPTGKIKVDAITLYGDGRITFSFHNFGVKQTFVDEWSEDAAENYWPCGDEGI